MIVTRASKGGHLDRESGVKDEDNIFLQRELVR